MIQQKVGWMFTILQAIYRELLLLRQQVVPLLLFALIIKFTHLQGPGTFCVSAIGNAAGSNTVSYVVVAGGGGGGGSVSGTNGGAGGGGAGGYREGRTSQCTSWTASPIACTSGPNAGLPVSVQGYSITVGGGGGGNSADKGTSGNPSIFSTITSTGGGGAGGRSPANPGGCGADGGSGGRQWSR